MVMVPVPVQGLGCPLQQRPCTGRPASRGAPPGREGGGARPQTRGGPASRTRTKSKSKSKSVTTARLPLARQLCSHGGLQPVVHMDVLCGSLWFSVVLCGSLWFSVVLCGSLWFFVVLCGSLWFSVVLCGSLWFFVALVEILIT
ncbi:hypothetical protein EYF80_066517 [Liparis tanakae]|uniref:Uncharacterized protein n=1 Tax=Liparis tanakae TaxID=230148 RepID=A0A4Z2E3L5_9TELE|nr:hypothetical protein EYF80_066517 [Liparis tanakae]